MFIGLLKLQQYFGIWILKNRLKISRAKLFKFIRYWSPKNFWSHLIILYIFCLYIAGNYTSKGIMHGSNAGVMSVEFDPQVRFLINTI